MYSEQATKSSATIEAVRAILSVVEGITRFRDKEAA
jgi:hypothetical protein